LATYSNSRQTRQALIDAAGELAAALGFGNVSTRAIAKRAMENVGSIHYHFGSKGNLFEAVLTEATRDMRKNASTALLSEMIPFLTTREGQAQAIRAIVHRKIQVIFNPDKPVWHCSVIYQVLRTKGPLREFLLRTSLMPSLEADATLFSYLRPDLSHEARFLHALVMGTPVYFHADYMEVILEILGGEGCYYPEYLQDMEDIIVRQTLLYFGLPDGGECKER